MRSAEVFLDANILLYACSAAKEDALKRRRAEELILNTAFCLSAQVLQEFIANALRKKALGISESQVEAMLKLAAMVPVVPVSFELVVAGVAIRRRFCTSHWDATIIAAALERSCHTLYSEDLPHGQSYDGVKVVNPFL